MFKQSFRAHLIIGAMIWISIGLGFSGFLLAAMLREIVTSQFDHDLSDHAQELVGLVDVDPQQNAFVHRDLSDPRFLPPRSGLYWQVQLQNGATIRSPSLDGLELPFEPHRDNDPQPFIREGPTGPIRLIQREVQSSQLKERFKIGVGVDERLIDQAMAQLNATLAWSLGFLALGLIGAAYAQVAYGLRPLARIRRAVVAIRAGNIERVPDDLPLEVLPLVTELNGLITANHDMVRRARIQAGNFAHALKTPLMILMEQGRELEHLGHTDAARVLFEQCTQMKLQIDYQTARARASAHSNAGTATAITPVIQNVIGAVAQLCHDRRIAFQLNGSSGLAVACDPHDLSEMIGNLIDNAAKWARTQVVVSILNLENVVRILVEDDGTGIPTEHRETVFGIGNRLDEQMPGSGLGLAIARDLATLHGGRTWIEPSKLGGVAAYLELSRIKPKSP